MDSVRAMLDLESAASEVEMLEALKQLTVKLLKDLCREKSLKLSGNKAELIGRLLSYWARSFADDSDGEHSATSSGSSAVAGSAGCCEMPSFRQIRAWNKDLSCLRNFSFRQLYEYLVNNKDKTYDKKSMKAYKSLKAYKYFKDSFVRNVWSNSHKETQLVVVRAHCFSSLKAKTTYTVYVMFKKDGTVVTAECNCVAGRGGACSHVAALLFFIEDFKKKEAPLPSDRTVTDRLQQWHVPPKRNVAPQPVAHIKFQKAVYGKAPRQRQQRTLSRTSTAADSTSPLLKKLVNDIGQSNPFSGLAHFWSEPEKKEEEGGHATVDEVADGLTRLAKKLIVFDSCDRSLPQSALDLSAINTEGEYFKDICQSYVSEQIIDQPLVDFVEQTTRSQSDCSLWKELHV